MDAVQSESPHGIGSVKAAISLFGERINGKKPGKSKAPVGVEEGAPTGARDLHVAKMDIDRLNKIKTSAEEEKAQAESELSHARNVVKQLARQIEESKARTSARKLAVEPTAKSDGGKEQYTAVLQDLDKVKQELSRLKLDVASAIEAKNKSEKEVEASSSKLKSQLHSVKELSNEIDEANEEHVLVELARIEAERELREIESQKGSEAAKYATSIEAAKKRIRSLRREINRSKELEMKLAVTNSDVEVLQNEMKLVRAMEKSYQNDLVKNTNKKGEVDAMSLLRSTETELVAAKKELALIKEEGFQFMTSMDLIRKELIQISLESSKLKKLEKKADYSIQHLNSKLSKTKSKLDSAILADERARAIVSSLSSALQQIQSEKEAAMKEKELIDDETTSVKLEVEKTNMHLSSIEKRLEFAVRELKAVKTSEAKALKKLKVLTEKTMRTRAASISYSNMLTLSKSEYDYLSRQAAAAKVVAKKKVEAAQAWIEAFTAGEKEMSLKAELIEKEIREFRAVEVREIYEMEKLLVAQKTAEGEVHNLKRNDREEEDVSMHVVVAKPRKSVREDEILVVPKRGKTRRVSASSATRHARSPSFTVKKKRKVMPNLVKFLSDRKTSKHK